MSASVILETVLFMTMWLYNDINTLYVLFVSLEMESHCQGLNGTIATNALPGKMGRYHGS